MRRASSSVELLEAPITLPIPLELRRSPRARRISLRVDLAHNRIVLVAPSSISRARALDFLVRNAGWLEARLGEMPVRQPFVDGATIPVMGIPHRIEANAATLRGRVERNEQIITVPGAPEHLPRRLADYLKAEARHEISLRARAKAETLGAAVKSITLRDTSSRWGSCNSAGRLSFSWRLIFAPESVLDYVVAHEVAHLREMNHGPRFWKLCAHLTTADSAAARAWLRRHGSELHRYG